MKRAVVGVLIAIGATAVGLSITAARRAPTIRPNVSVAGVQVGGETIEDAARKLRVWWESEKLKPLKLHCEHIKTALPDLKPGDLGVTLDDEASVDKLPMQTVIGDATAVVTREDFPVETFDPIFKLTGEAPLALEETIRKDIGQPRPAHVVYDKGAILLSGEISGNQLDTAALVDAVAKAFKYGEQVDLPIISAPKRVSDDQLAEIKEVVSEFHTHFPRYQYNRNHNIKVASSRLNGIVLMPGEQMSFNKTVGQRTIKHGFMLAGVYKNGKHDTGIGGGICQVSTTLYNASLFGNLKIVRRSNHSMPVTYVPLGRDATVDYGSLDLVIENDYSTPIAVSSDFQPGTLTFRILGKKEPGEWVKIIQVGGKSWDRAVQVIHDPKLKPGATVVVDKGSRGHSIRTYRLHYKNGVLVKKEQLGFSFYGGGDKIVAVGPPTQPAPGLPVMPPTIQGTKVSAPIRGPGN